MKKILTIILAALLAVSVMAACGEKPEEQAVNNDKVVTENDVAENEAEETDKQEDKIEEEEGEKSPEAQQNQESKPSAKPQETKPSNNNTAEKAPEAQQPAESTPPAEKPQEAPAATLGNTLLADFKAKAGAGMSTLEIAEGLIQNEAILFMGGAMEIEPGLLSGFGNTEITGFKNGAVFMPMIGSIAFVGYVFELEDASSVPSFISTLKANADMRWNICVEAEEMVTGSVGNKVFFVMCPKTLEE